MRVAPILTALVLVASTAGAQLPPNLNKYIDTVLTKFEVPGMGIAIVQDGKVVLAKGYGVKRLGENATVDEHTLFPIASNSKAFTAMALAILVDEGKMKWDDPVINYLPWFRMSDPWVTSQITVRDLLVHHSGIPAYAGDVLLFPPSTYTRRQILEKVKLIPLVKGFRTTYAYDNILYVAAGEVVKAVANMDYEDFVQTRIIGKVGMTETTARFSSLKYVSNLATGHLRLHNKVEVEDQFLDQIIGDAGNPAGGIASSAADMAKWMLTELDSGRAPNHTALLSASGTSELWKVVRPIPISTVPEEFKPAQLEFFGYALGVRVGNYGKYKFISHGGKLDGFVSHVILIPKLKLGITILTNQESAGAYMSIIYHVLDYYMKNPAFHWIKSYEHALQHSLVDWQEEWNKSAVVPSPNAPVPEVAEKYLGIFRDRFYGDLTIARNSTGMALQFLQTPQLNGVLTPFQYNTFKVTFGNKAMKADAYVSFSMAPDGSVDNCELKVIDPDSDISFNGLVFKKDKNR